MKHWYLLIIFPFSAFITTLHAREWSEPIRLTYHQGELLENFFKAQVTQNGEIHVIYELENTDHQRNNSHEFYQVFNKNGNAITENLMIHPDLERTGQTVFYTDIQHGKTHFILFGSDMAYHYYCLSVNGDTIVQPRRIETLTEAWNDYMYFPNGTYGPHLAMNQENELIYGLVEFGRTNDVPHWDITYSRLDTTGQVIDSIITVHRFDHLINRDLFEVDVHGNIYFCCHAVEPDGNHAYLTKIDPHGNVIEEVFRLQPYHDDTRYLDAQEMYVDDEENVYLAVIDYSGIGITIHGQKINSDFETEFDIVLCTSLSMSVRTGIAGENGKIALYSNYSGEGPDELNSALLTFNSEGEIIDSIDYFAPEHLLAWKSFFHNDDFYLLYTRSHRDLDRELYLIRSLNNFEGVPENSPIPAHSIILDAYPRPFNHNLKINLNSPFSGAHDVQIFDLNGRKLFSKKILLQSNHPFNMSWDGRNQHSVLVPTGTYFLRVLPANASSSKLEIIQHLK